MQQIETNNTILKALENLGALSSNFGLYEIKPFRDWHGSDWEHKIFTFRLLNAGELLDIMRSAPELSGEAKEYYKKFELLSRSIWAVEKRPLITEEEVKTYNESNKTEFTIQEFLVRWVRNLEDVVLSRLDAIYTGLQVKQVRILQGVYGCAECGNVFKEIPKNAAVLEYSLAEIICNNCLPVVDKTLYDFKLSHQQPPPPSETKLENTQVNLAHKCNCGKEFEDIESYRTHIQTCPSYQL